MIDRPREPVPADGPGASGPRQPGPADGPGPGGPRQPSPDDSLGGTAQRAASEAAAGPSTASQANGVSVPPISGGQRVAGQAARHSPGFAAGAQPTYSHLHAVLRSGRFAVTAELGPPRSASLAPIRRKAKLLRDWVDAANVTDGQSAVVRLASWAGCLVAMQEGVEPVMQLQCRDRNRIALQSDLLGAAAVGIPNVLLLTGDHPRFGDHPDAKPVFDLDSVQLVWTARTMRDQHRLLSGREVRTPPSWLIGAVENPFAPPERFRAERLGKKIAAGAQFVQTQFVFDVPVFARWMQQVRDLGLDERCWILAGTGPIRSLRALEHMCREVPGMHVPDEVVRRLRGVPEDRVAAEGLTICAEVVEQVRAMPGVAGVHLMAFAWEEAVPEILDRAGIGARRGAGFEVRGASRTTSDLAPRSPNPRAERG